jgi:hypothetical protein
MAWVLYKCTRCGKSIQKGNERFIGKYAYGARCYDIVIQQQIAFEEAARKRAKHDC